MKTVELTHDYDASADRLWRMANDFGALEKVTHGTIRFQNMPGGQTKTGQIADVRVSIFGLTPWQDYRMEVLERDDKTMTLRSAEHGAGVKSWRHTLWVTDRPNGASRLHDRIEIDAGILSPVFA